MTFRFLRKMASNGCLGEPVARVTRSAMKRKFTTTVDEPHKYKQKTARDSNDESSKLIENSLLGNSIDTKKSLNAAADTGENDRQNLKSKNNGKPVEITKKEKSPVYAKSDSGKTKSPAIRSQTGRGNSNKVKTSEKKPEITNTVEKLTNSKGSKTSKRKAKDFQPSKDLPANSSKTTKSDDEDCKHFPENNDDPKIKKEKVSKSKKSSSTKNGTNNKEDGFTKPELMIPDIIIPVNKIKILRKDGPSPWNGTIKYDNKIFLGAHISAAGGLENAIANTVKIAGSSFALFLKNQRQWVSKPMEESTVDRFKAAYVAQNFSPHLILPHGSYLMNCGSSDPTILSKSRATLLDEVQRCERLGILYYNIHPGSTCGKGSREEAIQNIADSINWVHDQTPDSKVAVALENMCRQGHTIGGDFSELADIIQRVFDESRIGVCLDTCHALAAGYDLASSNGFDAFLEEFERIIGFRYLVAVHLNDSEGALGCHRDRHASIGKGHIGLEGFRRIINCPRFRDIPLVLETPFISDDFYKQEILLLKSLAESGTICA